MSGTLSAREQRLLLDVLGMDDLSSVLTDDDGIQRLRASWLGGSLRHARSEAVSDGRTFFQVETRGIALGHIEPAPAGFVALEWITWLSLREHRAATPANVLDAIKVTSNAVREHFRGAPTFARPADPAAFADAHIAFQRSQAEPWGAEAARLMDARRDAVLRAFPASTSEEEPTDLLGFLAQLEAVTA
jgi:hypothetical protein